jgi:hypothetical protein
MKNIKQRHSNENKRVLLNNPDLIEAEVETLRKSLRLNDEAELLMMISIATDETIRLVCAPQGARAYP